MLQVQLRAEGSGLVGEDFIFNLSAVCDTVEMPGCLVELVHGDRLPGPRPRTDAVHVLGEIAHLVEGIPDRQLHVALRKPRAQNDFHSDQMLRPIGQRNHVSNRSRLRGGLGALRRRRQCDLECEEYESRYESRSRREPHALADAFSGWLPEAPPANDFRR